MIAAVALFAAETATAPGPVTVSVLRAHLHDWNGRRIEVRGWVQDCDHQLGHPCFLTPGAAWHRGRDRIRVEASAPLQLKLDRTVSRQVVVTGTVQVFTCPKDVVCLDGEDKLIVEAIVPGGRSGR